MYTTTTSRNEKTWQLKAFKLCWNEDPIFELGNLQFSESVLGYDPRDVRNSLTGHRRGHFGYVTQDVQAENWLALSCGVGTIVSVYPSIYRGNQLVMMTSFYPAGYVFTHMSLKEELTDELQAWLRDVIDTSRFARNRSSV